MDDVGKVSSRKFVDLLLDWQIALALRLLIHVLKHVDDGQAVVLWNRDVFDRVRFYVQFGPRSDVSQVPDGDVLWLRQVDLAFACEKAETLDLAGESAGELC